MLTPEQFLKHYYAIEYDPRTASMHSTIPSLTEVIAYRHVDLGMYSKETEVTFKDVATGQAYKYKHVLEHDGASMVRVMPSPRNDSLGLREVFPRLVEVVKYS